MTSETLSLTLATLSSTALTLSSTACVASRFSAMAIRDSSCVSLSSLFSASSISVFPISLFPYFSGHSFSRGRHTHTKLLTDSALLHLLSRNPEDRGNFDHYLNVRVHHFRGRPHLCVDLYTLETTFNAPKDVYKCFVALLDIL